MSSRRIGRLEQLESRRLLHGEILDFGSYRSAVLEDGSIYLQVYGHDAIVEVDQLHEASLRDIYEIDQRGSGPSTLELIAGHVARATNGGDLSILQDTDDRLELFGDWRVDSGEWEGDEYVHKISDGEISLLVADRQPWRNPLNAFDANADQHISSTDVLLIVNHINQFGPGPAIRFDDGGTPRYSDPTGDSNVASGDVLALINELNSQGAGRIVPRVHGHPEPAPREIPAGFDVPQIAIHVAQDHLAGWNLSVDLTDFRLAPEKASLEAVPGEGHLHVYVDGIKTARLYSTDYYLGKWPEGVHEVAVVVTANDHAPYSIDGNPIKAVATFEVVPSEPKEHYLTPREVDDTQPIPTVSLEVLPDAVSGWNVRATLEGFHLAPEHVSSSPVPGEGHLHLLVDGNKITRLYDQWHHIGSLPLGTQSVGVELSGNDHATLLHNGVALGDSVPVSVTLPQRHG